MAIDMVAFLVDRKFPIAKALRAAGPNVRGVAVGRRLEILKEADAYRAKLTLTPQGDLNALYQDELRKRDEQAAAANLRGDEARFFHQASAMADFDYWAKAAYWTLDEAVALALGKNPELVHPSSLASYRVVSPFVSRFDRLKNLAVRAKGVGKLFDPVLPPIFVGWVADNGIEFPDVLRDAVVKKGSPISWDSISKDQSEVIEKLKKIIEINDARIANFEATEVALRKQLAQAAEMENSPEPATKPQSPVERENMLKAILAMATQKYGYDASKSRGDAVPKICNAIHAIGLNVSDDTIRRYLAIAEARREDWLERER